MWVVKCVCVTHARTTIKEVTELDSLDVYNMSDHRTDMCNEAARLMNGTAELSTILEEKTFTFLTFNSPTWYEVKGGTEDPEISGFHNTVLEYVAVDAGFTYNMMRVNRSAVQNLSYSEWYDKISANYDLILDWALQSEERSLLGLVVPYSFLDLSITVSGYSEMEEQNLELVLFGFLDPFENHLWVTLLATVFVTAFFYLAIELSANPKFDADYPVPGKFFNSFFVGVSQMFGYLEYAPQTWLSRMVVVSYSFVCLVTVASYTANLATMLIAETQYTVSCTSIKNCGNKKKVMCIDEASAMYDWAAREYPEFDEKNLFLQMDQDIFEFGLAKGKCDVVVSTNMQYEIALGNKKVNSDCHLMRYNNEYELKMRGGWIGHADYTDKCTSVFLDALRSQLVSAASDGIIETAYVDRRDELSTMGSCNEGTDTGQSLSILNMAGIVSFHCIILALLICSAPIQRISKKTTLCHSRALIKETETDDNPEIELRKKPMNGAVNVALLKQVSADIKLIQTKVGRLFAYHRKEFNEYDEDMNLECS